MFCDSRHTAPAALGTTLQEMTATQIDRAPTILIVEDNEDNRIVYSTMLRHFGFAVDEAENGAEGILKARTGLPDLILMDIAIPLVDGWEAVQRLKKDPATAAIPIVALTAHAMPADREKAIQVGCDGYLAKPCEPRAVVEEVRRILESKTV